ncbi:hypothetical protein [Micromonospora avicenniae]|uniref:Uncharacterized protein n=1 Tax=Micromonospora avicenniae TaxID=1198245 RepID=A0A1N6R3F1_9ACTN|nr:hypothetical protein [Micromonospora avicenniae]SIQ23297.1 hypothetical protein SAMN05444858_101583 [Micromonospora avicenniae]
MNEPVPDPFADRPDWAPRPPRPVEIVPATARVGLRGRRVQVGLPGLGWRGDLRADDRVVQGSRTYVPVIPEHEWYRAETDQIEVFAPLVPVERVWVETVGAQADGSTGREPGLRLVSLDGPSHRTPIPVVDADSVAGRRVVHVVDSTEHRDLRAVTETYSGADGDICVRVAAEAEWYRWAWRGQAPTTLEVPVHLLWIE